MGYCIHLYPTFTQGDIQYEKWWFTYQHWDLNSKKQYLCDLRRFKHQTLGFELEKGTGSRNDAGWFYGDASICAKWTARRIIMINYLGIPSNRRGERDGSCLQVLPWKMCDQFFPRCQICCVKLLVSYHLCEKSVVTPRDQEVSRGCHDLRLEVLPCSDPGPWLAPPGANSLWWTWN